MQPPPDTGWWLVALFHANMGGRRMVSSGTPAHAVPLRPPPPSRPPPMNLLAAILLLIAGTLASLYAGFCLLGGPDGALLSRNSILFGLPALALAILLSYAASRFAPAGIVLYAPPLAVLLAWSTALIAGPQTGFYIWIVGTPLTLLVGIAHLLLSLRSPPPGP